MSAKYNLGYNMGMVGDFLKIIFAIVVRVYFRLSEVLRDHVVTKKSL